LEELFEPMVLVELFRSKERGLPEEHLSQLLHLQDGGQEQLTSITGVNSPLEDGGRWSSIVGEVGLDCTTCCTVLSFTRGSLAEELSKLTSELDKLITGCCRTNVEMSTLIIQLEAPKGQLMME
jgi:hypothetical protein